ncbi:MAG: hypothetical protein RR394_03950 [Oscillospiraceae bacterium]
MFEISTNIILDGITLALHSAYPASHIHGEEVSQGLKPGDFIVKLVTAQQKPITKARMQRIPVFDVLYFPKAGKIECCKIGDALCETLELITLPGGGKIRGGDMCFEIIDGIMHFHVCYGHVIRCDEAKINMEGYALKQGG